MADITPTPPVIPPLGQSSAHPPLLPTTLLPVQILDLPESLLKIQQQINLTGALQIATENQLALSTTLGQILFSLPQLRTNPLLLQQLLPYIEGGKTVQLHIAPSPDGVLHGNLTLIAPTPLTTTTEPPNLAPLANLLGKDVPVLILPQATNPLTTTPQQQPAIPQATATPALSKLAQQFLQLLTGTPQLPAANVSTNAGPASPQLNQGMSLKIQQFLSPGQSPPVLAPDEFIATVTGYSAPLQHPILTAGNTSFMLKTSANLQQGSMAVLKMPQPQMPDIAESTETSGKIWPALQQVIAHTQPAESTPLQQFSHNRMPQMNQALGGAMLFMLAAFNRGDARQWLGQDSVESLERVGKKNLIAALQDEMREHMTTATDPVVGQWRVYHLPYMMQQQLASMQIYVHHDDSGGQTGSDDKSTRKTRFIIDITFTRLGAMQFDGFVQNKKFDLMLRSAQTLEPGLRHELRYAFADAVSAVGMTGQLLFQQGSQGWMRFPQEKHETLQA